MEKITSFDKCVEYNKIFVDSQKSFLENNSIITFSGKGNILFVEDGVKLSNSHIDFLGDNALVYLSKSWHVLQVVIKAYCGSCVFIGQNNFINGQVIMLASERKNIIIGNDGLISLGIWVRTADPHLIYSCETKNRINPSRSVLIGDHVWIGQNAMILKGSVIGSGSILGGGSILANKEIPSNVSVVGNPAKIVSEKIFFTGECVHNWREEQTEQYQIMDTDKWIYSGDDAQIGLKEIDKMICAKCSAEDKLDIVLDNIVRNTSKNRFYLANKKHL